MKKGSSMKLLQSIAIFFIVPGISIVVYAATQEVDPFANPPSPAFEGQTAAPAPQQSSSFEMEVLVSDLTRPRSLVVLPDGNLLVAEGAGSVRVILPDGSLSEPLSGMPPVRSVDDRGFSDFVLDAAFADNRRVYFTYLAPPPGEAGGPMTVQDRTNATELGVPFQIPQVATGRLSEDLSQIEDVQVIAEITGRRLISAPDGTLYITTVGAGGARPEVQDLTTLTGKVLRINGDGSIPEDNPFYGRSIPRQEIFAIGHRDPDGGFIHPETGELWTIEHGPMGGDELNIIRPGQNSGWANVSYGKNYDGTEIGPSALTGTEQPLYYWFPSVAPSGLMMYTGDLFPEWQGNLFLGTMSPTQGKFLVRLIMDGETVVAEEHLLVEHDRRVRFIAQGTDGALYVLTDSEDNNETDRHFVGEVLKLTPAN